MLLKPQRCVTTQQFCRSLRLLDLSEMVAKKRADLGDGKSCCRKCCDGCREHVLHALPHVDARIDTTAAARSTNRNESSSSISSSPT